MVVPVLLLPWFPSKFLLEYILETEMLLCLLACRCQLNTFSL